MRLDIYVHVTSDSAKQDLILAKLDEILQKEDMELADLTQLQNDVASEGNVVQSAITLLQGLKSQLDAAIASNDPAALDALSQQLEAQTQSLANAVAANTPAASQPPAQP